MDGSKNQPGVFAFETKKRSSILPESYDKRRAIVFAVIALLLFGLGALLGAHLPWWIMLVLAVGAGVGGFIGAAYFNSSKTGRDLYLNE